MIASVWDGASVRMLETLEEAQGRADAYQRLLWLAIRQAGGKITIHPTTMMLWGPTSLLKTFGDVTTGGMTLVADIRTIRPSLESTPVRPNAAMLGYGARDRGEPCKPPAELDHIDNALWIQGWQLCDEQIGPKEPA